MDYFKVLPEEITLEILTRVPTESIFECKLVCTTWTSLVRHPSFPKMHLRHLDSDSGKLTFIAVTREKNGDNKFQYFEYNQDDQLTTTPIERTRRISFDFPFQNLEFVGSCNGLICFSFALGQFCIYNPVLRESIVLPLIKPDYDDKVPDFKKDSGEVDFYDIVYHRVSSFISTSGFGYVSSTNEFKVVAVTLSRKTKLYHVCIYTLGSKKGWRKLGIFNNESKDLSGKAWGKATFANGALYWLSLNSEWMLTVDLAAEKFCEHFAPPPLPQNRNLNTIGVLDGFLFYAVEMVAERDRRCYQVWLLKNKNNTEQGKDQSWVWSKDLRIDGSNMFAVTNTDDALTYTDNYLNINDTKALTSKRLVDLKEEIVHVFPHKNSLVSLNELGEESVKMMEADDQPSRQL